MSLSSKNTPESCQSEKMEMAGFILRLRFLMDRNGIKRAKELEQALGMRNAVYRWKNFLDKPTPDSLLKIAQYFGVSVEWLMTGKEPSVTVSEITEPYDSRTPAPVDTERIAQVVQDAEDYLVKVRLKISPTRKGKLIAMLYEYWVTEGIRPDPDVIKAYLRLTNV